MLRKASGRDAQPISVIAYDEATASAAFEHYSDLVRASCLAPTLQDDPTFARMKREAFRRFEKAFEALL